MARPSRNRSSSSASGSKRVWAIIGVVLFLLADVVLVGFALSTTRASSDSDIPETLPTLSEVSPTPSPTPSTSSSQSPAPDLFVATSATAAWRSTPGTCGGTDAVIESSTDGGVIWVAHSTGAFAVHEVLSLTPVSDSQATVVGKAGSGCTIGVFSTFTSGDFWQTYPDQLPAQTYIDSVDRSTVKLPAGAVPAPCAQALQAQVWNGQPVVLCADALYQLSADTGEWVSAPAPGARSLSIAGDSVTIASIGTSCPGVEIGSVALPLGEVAPSAIGCAADVSTDGEVSLSQSGTTVWLWAGEKVEISDDAGVTW